MIVVGLDGCGTHRGRRNLQSVFILDHGRIEPPQFSRERADAIALVMADERDVADFGRRRRERRNRGEGRDHVGHRIHRDLDAGEAPGACNLDVVGMPGDARAHLLQYAEKSEVALHRVRGEAFDSHRTADERGGRREIAGARRVRLNDEALPAIPLPAAHDDRVAFDGAVRAPRLHQAQRHVDEGAGSVADHAELEAGLPDGRGHQHG